jgi:sterol desaturase/sphingolipid hydroxylase (fatty acid hydroxylase superfamily)
MISTKTIALIICVALSASVLLPQVADADSFAAAASSSYHAVVPSWIREAIYPIRARLGHTGYALLLQTVLQPYLYIMAALALALERAWPVARKRNLFAVAFRQDLFWFVTNAVFKLTVIAALYGYLSQIYDKHLAFLTITEITPWPAAARVVVSLLVFDLFLWVVHRLHHGVYALWCFHLLHHSQRSLNFFTEDRFHVVEAVLSLTVRYVPMRMVGLGFEEIFLLTLLMEWYTRLYHAAIKTNYGPLKYFLVTPQSHRIHHSIEPRHWGKNFATYFTIWDRLFGTLYPSYDEYPETGVPDAGFPYETASHPVEVLRVGFLQFIVPFRLCLGLGPDLSRGARAVEGAWE